MYIKYVKIENFRGIKKAHLDFEKGTYILIGPSDVGKSAVLSAIDIVLNPDYSWNRHDILCELDFYHSQKDTSIKIEILLGCGRLNCFGEGKDKCPYFELNSNGRSIICKFAESQKLVTWDNKSKKFLKEDDINDDRETRNRRDWENTVRIKLEAGFQEPEGRVETKHILLNEDGEEWGALTQAMKDWVGARLLTGDREPTSEIKIQYNSLLSKSVHNLPEWRKICGKKLREALNPAVKKFKDDYSENLFNEITGEGEEKREWELPFSRQGRSFQNISSIILGAHAARENPNSPDGFSILMLEDPGRNLDPQLQRSSIENVKQICGKNSQIIISTHSPYIISPLLKLDGVKRLNKTNGGELLMTSLDEITAGRKTFFILRKQVPHELELFEALFSSLVVLWEGDSETGFYQTLIRLKENFPSEMLAGLNGGGDGCRDLALWLKNAGYDVVVILDGDKELTLNKLYEDNIPFIALPPKKKIEHIIVEQLQKIDENIAARGLISSIGAAGKIFWKNDFNGYWPALAEIIKEEGSKQSIETETALKKFKQRIKDNENMIMPKKLDALLASFKKRHFYQELAFFFHQEGAIPKLCETILGTLEEFWFKSKELKQYQFNENGELNEFKDF
jgi:predicted ATP-dependent endonuclease of OLD family